MWFSDIRQSLMLRPRWQRHGLLFILLILLFGLVVLLCFQPRQRAISELKRQVILAEQMLVLTYKQMAEMPALVEVESQWRSIADEILGYWQEKEDISQKTDAIVREVAQSGVQLNDLKYLATIQDDGFIIFQWRLDVAADYYPLITLIQRWAVASQLYVIDEWSLRDNADQLSLSLTLSQYQIQGDAQ